MSDRLPRGGVNRFHHRLMLVIAVLVVILSFVLDVLPGGETVGLAAYPAEALPPSCWSRTVMDVECPACGLTRSFIHLAHGDISASLGRHRLGWLLAALVAFQIPYRLWRLRSGREGSGRWGMVVLWVLLGLFVANWAWNLAAG